MCLAPALARAPLSATVSPMCNCSQLPFAVADPEERSFAFSGMAYFPKYFEAVEGIELDEGVVASQISRRCEACGQWWWIVVGLDETPFPLFALKTLNENPPEPTLVASAQSFLCILAHGGFSPGRCRHKGCANWKLSGRELCHLHLAFP